MQIDREGVITTFEFGCTYDAGKPAAARTDSGVREGSSAREIVKAHGEPTHRIEGKMGRFELLFLQYDHGDQRLAFCFKDGSLFSIAIEKN